MDATLCNHKKIMDAFTDAFKLDLFHILQEFRQLVREYAMYNVIE